MTDKDATPDPLAGVGKKITLAEAIELLDRQSEEDEARREAARAAEIAALPTSYWTLTRVNDWTGPQEYQLDLSDEDAKVLLDFIRNLSNGGFRIHLAGRGGAAESHLPERDEYPWTMGEDL